MFIENYLTEKGLYDEALESMSRNAMEAHGELPFEWILKACSRKNSGS